MSDSDMKIKSIAPWYGSKRMLAPRTVELIGAHKSYWEPFCGSMAVLFAKPRCPMETVNDLHGDLINLARVIQDPVLGEQLYDKLSRTLCAERFFQESKERWTAGGYDNDKLDIQRAYDYFVTSWLGINGVSGTKRTNYTFALRWCKGGGQGASRWRNTTDSIPAWHQRLRNVLIIQRDAFDLIANIEDEKETVIYIDPPYVEKGDKYVHSFQDEEHKQLAEILRRFKKTLVIVSYYDHPLLTPLYSKWEKMEIKMPSNGLRNAMRHGLKQGNDRVEVLFTNKKQKGPLF